MSAGRCQAHRVRGNVTADRFAGGLKQGNASCFKICNMMVELVVTNIFLNGIGEGERVQVWGRVVKVLI